MALGTPIGLGISNLHLLAANIAPKLVRPVRPGNRQAIPITAMAPPRSLRSGSVSHPLIVRPHNDLSRAFPSWCKQ